MTLTSPLIRIVDDDHSILDSLGYMLRFKGFDVQCWDRADTFLREDMPSRPGCLILDIKMPGLNGLEVQKILSDRKIELPIIFLTAHGDVESAVHTMKNGAFDFVQKPIHPQEFIQTIENAIKRSFFNENFSGTPQEAQRKWEKLSEREKEIALLIVKGIMHRQIGERLGISKRTVDNHRASINKKLNINSLSQLQTLIAYLTKESC